MLRPGLRILHVAPEQCLREELSKLPQVDYIAGDKHEPGYRYPVGTVDLDITDLPFPDDRFDLILCSHVLEHVPEDRKAMGELHRVLARGGLGILMVPIRPGYAATEEDLTITDPQERLRRYGQFDHVRIYGLDYTQRLKDVGFQVTEVWLAERMTAEDVFRSGVSRGEVLHAVTK